MTRRIKSAAAGTALLMAAGATAVWAQSYDPELTAYHYVYYSDAAKTQYQGEISDQGCAVSGNYVYVVRANVPSPYYDAYPMYVCSGMGPWLPPDW